MSIILGIDPGSRVTGFGVVRLGPKGSQKITPLSYGVIKMDLSKDFSERMRELSDALAEIFLKHKPDAVAVEKIFLGKNADSAFKLGHARGVALCEASRSGAQVFEYATRVVKKTVAGKGSASKQDVAVMVEKILGLKKISQEDASDALALALHHAFQKNFVSVESGILKIKENAL